MATKPDAGEKLIASNKKALHDYFVLQKAEAGVALTGTEVKSLRDGKANIKDSYVLFKDGEAFLFNAHISPYSHGNLQNHEPERNRKLLLHRREIEKLREQVVEKGLTVVPLRLYFKGGKVKVEIAVVRGKKLYDKRETEKKRELDREAAVAMKQR
ncbi:MAG: SsrA-binding protein SmpB [Acidobacteria bacterium]|nr:SsrA-binding protein SmpB [Acidobacteriota bacterium]MBV9071458.1 SsrA-binding protein SmpB [Acidobacteriota bacterium]MBV9186551.1 SsrA-binding protein SmpB [Acidobacteriota bacterium]